MFRKLFPIVLLLIGAGAGVGAGIYLRSDKEVTEVKKDPGKAAGKAKDKAGKKDAGSDLTREYVKMNNQFVVPIVKGDDVEALVVMSLNLEVPAGQKDAIYSQEPKLRDSFLQVMFDHANVGGFDGAFTDANTLNALRGALREAAHKVMGEQITDVLIVEIVRQDY